MSEDANITALGEKVRKIKSKLHFLKFIAELLILFFIVWGMLLFLVGAGAMGSLVGFLVGTLTFICLVKLVDYKFQKLVGQETELKKRLLTLLYPTPNCFHCGKLLIEGNKFCTYCGNNRQP